MDFSYEENEVIFQNYINACREKIKTLLLNNEELNQGIPIKKSLIDINLATEETKVNDAIKIHRNRLIDIKLNHTMRIVSDVTKMSQKMQLNINFEKVLQISALLHDIGRFYQVIWSNNFYDKDCQAFNGMNHAEYGYHLLYINKDINKFKIPFRFKYAITQPVKYHQIPKVTNDLALHFTNTNQLDVDAILTGNEDLNEAEKIIIATLVQMVKDVDMLDILYQHLTNEFPVISPHISYRINNDTLTNISKKWDISEQVLMEYNGLKTPNLANLTSIKIPTNHIDPKHLVVPKDIQKRFFQNDEIDLKELQSRNDYTFIIGMWWRLNHFLNNINFVSNLEIIEENNLLENILSLYPSNYKPLVEPAFQYAKEVLLEKSINENKSNIYVEKTR